MKKLILPAVLAITAAFNANAGYLYLVTECGYKLFPDAEEYESWPENDFWSYAEFTFMEAKKMCPNGDVYYFEDLPDPEPPVVDERRVIDPKKADAEETIRTESGK